MFKKAIPVFVMKNLFVLFTLFAIGCTTHYTVPIETIADSSIGYIQPEKIPVDIELRISSNITNLHPEVVSPTGGCIYSIVVGAELSQALESVTKKHFKHVHTGSKEHSPVINYDLVRFEPEVSFVYALGNAAAHASSDIALRVTITDGNGEQVISIIVQGSSSLSATQTLGTCDLATAPLNRTIQKAIEEAMQQLSIGLGSSRQIYDTFVKRF